MSLKAKVEAMIYAAEEPITLEQISLLLKDIVLAELAAARGERCHRAGRLRRQSLARMRTHRDDASELVAEADAMTPPMIHDEPLDMPEQSAAPRMPNLRLASSPAR